MSDRPCTSVLIVCSERSGSNLLKAILSQHPRIFVGPPIPLFECFRPIIDSYGELGDEANWHELVRDAVDLVAVNHQPLPCSVDYDTVLAETAGQPRGWATLVRAVYRIIARSKGAPVYGYKYSTNMHDLAEFMHEMAFSHVVYQVRDPRDVVLSTMKTGFVDEAPGAIAQRWRTAQELADAAASAHPGGALVQRYEDLVARPQRTLERLWDYLGVERCDEALAFHVDRLNQDIAVRSHAWANIGRPLMRRNYNKFYKEWNAQGVREIEQMLVEPMTRFGYRKSVRWFFRSRTREPETRVLREEENEFFRPQSEKWDEINRRARARMEGR